LAGTIQTGVSEMVERRDVVSLGEIRRSVGSCCYGLRLRCRLPGGRRGAASRGSISLEQVAGLDDRQVVEAKDRFHRGRDVGGYERVACRGEAGGAIARAVGREGDAERVFDLSGGSCHPQTQAVRRFARDAQASLPEEPFEAGHAGWVWSVEALDLGEAQAWSDWVMLGNGRSEAVANGSQRPRAQSDGQRQRRVWRARTHRDVAGGA
jgi:hypothetical protein